MSADAAASPAAASNGTVTVAAGRHDGPGNVQSDEDSTLVVERHSPHAVSCLWHLRNFSRLSKQKILYSKYFAVGGYDCRLLVYPAGDAQALPGYVSIYLQISDPAAGGGRWDCFASYRLSVRHADPARAVHRDSWHRFSAKKKSHGWCDFASLAAVLDPRQGFLAPAGGGTVTLAAEIAILDEAVSFARDADLGGAAPSAAGDVYSGRFTWRVRNFSAFRPLLRTQKIMSPAFPAGECMLRLSVYQSSSGGEEHLSMCLESKDTDRAAPGGPERSCWCLFRLAVLPHGGAPPGAPPPPGARAVHRDSYGRFGADARSGDNTSLGWNDFMRMAEFAGGDGDAGGEGGDAKAASAPALPYLVDDTAVFAATFHVIREHTGVSRAAGLSPAHALGAGGALGAPGARDAAAARRKAGAGGGGGREADAAARFTWRVENFTRLKDLLKKRKIAGLCIKSRRFTVAGRDCRLIVYPRGQSQPPTFLSMFLEVCDSRPGAGADWSAFVSHRLSVVAQAPPGGGDAGAPPRSVAKESQNRYSRGAKDWGWREFVSLTTLFDADAGFLVGDAVVFCAEVLVLKETAAAAPLPAAAGEPAGGAVFAGPPRPAGGELPPDAAAAARVSFAWRLENFGAFRDAVETRKVFSRFFAAGPVELRLGLYESFDALCVYLESQDAAPATPAAPAAPAAAPGSPAAGGAAGGAPASPPPPPAAPASPAAKAPPASPRAPAAAAGAGAAAAAGAPPIYWVRYRVAIVDQRDPGATVWREAAACTRAASSSVVQFGRLAEVADPATGLVLRDCLALAVQVLEVRAWPEGERVPDAPAPRAGGGADALGARRDGAGASGARRRRAARPHEHVHAGGGCAACGDGGLSYSSSDDGDDDGDDGGSSSDGTGASSGSGSGTPSASSCGAGFAPAVPRDRAARTFLLAAGVALPEAADGAPLALLAPAEVRRALAAAADAGMPPDFATSLRAHLSASPGRAHAALCAPPWPAGEGGEGATAPAGTTDSVADLLAEAPHLRPAAVAAVLGAAGDFCRAAAAAPAAPLPPEAVPAPPPGPSAAAGGDDAAGAPPAAAEVKGLRPLPARAARGAAAAAPADGASDGSPPPPGTPRMGAAADAADAPPGAEAGTPAADPAAAAEQAAALCLGWLRHLDGRGLLAAAGSGGGGASMLRLFTELLEVVPEALAEDAVLLVPALAPAAEHARLAPLLLGGGRDRAPSALRALARLALAPGDAAVRAVFDYAVETLQVLGVEDDELAELGFALAIKLAPRDAAHTAVGAAAAAAAGGCRGAARALRAALPGAGAEVLRVLRAAGRGAAGLPPGVSAQAWAAAAADRCLELLAAGAGAGAGAPAAEAAAEARRYLCGAACSGELPATELVAAVARALGGGAAADVPADAALAPPTPALRAFLAAHDGEGGSPGSSAPAAPAAAAPAAADADLPAGNAFAGALGLGLALLSCDGGAEAAARGADAGAALLRHLLEAAPGEAARRDVARALVAAAVPGGAASGGGAPAARLLAELLEAVPASRAAVLAAALDVAEAQAAAGRQQAADAADAAAARAREAEAERAAAASAAAERARAEARAAAVEQAAAAAAASHRAAAAAAAAERKELLAKVRAAEQQADWARGERDEGAAARVRGEREAAQRLAEAEAQLKRLKDAQREDKRRAQKEKAALAERVSALEAALARAEADGRRAVGEAAAAATRARALEAAAAGRDREVAAARATAAEASAAAAAAREAAAAAERRLAAEQARAATLVNGTGAEALPPRDVDILARLHERGLARANALLAKHGRPPVGMPAAAGGGAAAFARAGSAPVPPPPPPVVAAAAAQHGRSSSLGMLGRQQQQPPPPPPPPQQQQQHQTPSLFGNGGGWGTGLGMPQQQQQQQQQQAQDAGDDGLLGLLPSDLLHS